jgi:hypothetical protein
VDVSFFLPLAEPVRPPSLGPRRRGLDPNIERTLRAWVRSFLDLVADAPIELVEWVSLDSRAAPHTVFIIVGTGRKRRTVAIEKASERIVEADIRTSLRSRLVRSSTGNAPTR